MANEYVTNRPITGQDIRRTRLKMRMTQREFAAFVNVSQKTVERWESEQSAITGPIVVLVKLMGIYPDIDERLKIPPRKTSLRLWYMEGDEVCAVIDVDEAKRSVQVYNYDHDYLRLPFGTNRQPDYDDLEAFLESRCFPRTRDKIKIELDRLGIPFYDPMLIVAKTEGRMAEDNFRIVIER